MNFKLILSALAAVAVLGACGAPNAVRMDPTYDEAASSKFVGLNRDAVNRLIGNYDRVPLGETPVLVATIVNINDMRRAAP